MNSRVCWMILSLRTILESAKMGCPFLNLSRPFSSTVWLQCCSWVNWTQTGSFYEYVLQYYCAQVLRALRVVPGCDQAPSGWRVCLQSEDSQQRTHRGLHLQLHPGEPDPQERTLPQRQVKPQEYFTITLTLSHSYWSGNYTQRYRSDSKPLPLLSSDMRSCTIHHSHKQEY